MRTAESGPTMRVSPAQIESLLERLRHGHEKVFPLEATLPPGEVLTPAERNQLVVDVLMSGLVVVEGTTCCLSQIGREMLRLLLSCHSGVAGRKIPFYDAQQRVLFWDGDEVKKFYREAPCQDRVLSAFQLAGWPSRIADPLEQEDGLDPKLRLRETVKSLNRGLKDATIRFSADGTGTGFRWHGVPD